MVDGLTNCTGRVKAAIPVARNVVGNIAMNVVGNDDGVWMTYGQLAAARGVKRIAAVRIVQRHKWRHRRATTGRCACLFPMI
jgi:hypothetical protein